MILVSTIVTLVGVSRLEMFHASDIGFVYVGYDFTLWYCLAFVSVCEMSRNPKFVTTLSEVFYT